MLQLENTSPFAPAMMLFPDERGVDTVYVVVKATFSLQPKLELAKEQVPVTLADEYWGEPGESSLKYPTEAHLSKPGTDVMVVAEACAPNDRPVPYLDVGIAVAGHQQGARVFGDRTWKGNRISARPSDPVPFARMPLTYERTYGGGHLLDAETGVRLAETKNPIGCGFRGNFAVSDMIGRPLPNIEDLRAPLRSPGDATTVLGFGAVAPGWEPRAQYAGTYDKTWQKTRAPYLPKDFNSHFFHAAPPALVYSQPLRGGEPVVLLNLSPRGREQLSIPRCDVEVSLTVAGEVKKPPIQLESVLLEPTIGRMCLSWRAALACDKQALKVEKATIQLNTMELN